MAKRLDMQAFGQRIAQARTRGGWTQQELAENTGLQQAAIARLERGRQAAVRADTVMALAEGLGVSTDYLLGLSGEAAEEHAAAGVPAGAAG